LKSEICGRTPHSALSKTRSSEPTASSNASVAELTVVIITRKKKKKKKKKREREI
jgi:hypothetical protein